jgi:hypothetical protein
MESGRAECGTIEVLKYFDLFQIPPHGDRLARPANAKKPWEGSGLGVVFSWRQEPAEDSHASLLNQ